jgi:DNA-binding Lrp family transcriptional regulator
MKLKEIINLSVEKAVNETVRRLEAEGMIIRAERKTTEKTEDLLFNYPIYKSIQGKEKTAEIVSQIEQALAKIKKDPYYDIIEYYYFQRMTIETISASLQKNPRTIIRNKKRLLKVISPFIFSDELISALFP